jgi:hypothetical protein
MLALIFGRIYNVDRRRKEADMAEDMHIMERLYQSRLVQWFKNKLSCLSWDELILFWLSVCAGFWGMAKIFT